MKKIINYLYAVMLIIMGMTLFTSNVALADGNADEDAGVVEDKDIDKEDAYVILNANSSTGEAQLKIDGIQYTTARDVSIKLDLDKIKEGQNGETLELDYRFEVCEVYNVMVKDPVKGETKPEPKEHCISYFLEDEENKFQLVSMQDGKKTLEFYFYNGSNYGRKDYASRRVVKQIVLDTTGPYININEGEYVYLPKGQKYEEKGASCVDDSGFFTTACEVVYDPNPSIDMNKSGYQYVRYTAVDFFGNESNAIRKILVDTTVEEKSNAAAFWISAGIGVAILSALLFLQVWKNKEKQKNQSVL